MALWSLLQIYKENQGKFYIFLFLMELFLLYPFLRCRYVPNGCQDFLLLRCIDVSCYLLGFERFLGVTYFFTQQLLSIFEGSLLADNPCLAHGLVHGGFFE
jgi:hypothetical protein